MAAVKGAKVHEQTQGDESGPQGRYRGAVPPRDATGPGAQGVQLLHMSTY